MDENYFKIFLLKLKTLIEELYAGLNKNIIHINISLKLKNFQKFNILKFSEKLHFNKENTIHVIHFNYFNT